MIYALIIDGVVVNTIVADDNFITLIENLYEYCIRIDNLDQMPSIGWLYNGSTFSES